MFSLRSVVVGRPFSCKCSASRVFRGCTGCSSPTWWVAFGGNSVGAVEVCKAEFLLIFRI